MGAGTGAAAVADPGVTADAFKEAVEASVAAGFDAHLTKPISKATLWRRSGVCAGVRPAGCGCRRRRLRVTVDASVAALTPRYLKNMARELQALGGAGCGGLRYYPADRA